MAHDLKQAVQRHTERQSEAAFGVVTPVRGLYLVRRTSPSELEHTVVQPLVCLVLQGCKRVSLGSGTSSYAAGDTMVVTGNVPTVSRISKASVADPYLALAFDLDLSVITDLVMNAPEVHSRPSGQDTREELRDALRRLVLLLDRPESLAVLKDGLVREIHHWLLLGRQGLAVRHLGSPDSHARRVARAVAILRANYAKPVQIERLAEAAGMSRSGFHQHFRAITSLTPLQFQKQLRLIEARRLIVSSGKILSQVAFDVGYESTSQFSREYTRMYGQPPTSDKRAASARWETVNAAE
jgi:AraC-like DNA-binding protein